MRAQMRGPAEVTNWVVPGLLAIGAYPSGASKITAFRERGEDDDEGGCAGSLIFHGVRAFVDLMPDDEACVHTDTLGPRWRKLEEQGRKLLAQDRAASHASQTVLGDEDWGDGPPPLSAVACALQAILDRVHARESGVQVKASTAFQIASHEVKVCPRYPPDDPRHEEAERGYWVALAKERLSLATLEKSKRALRKLPNRLRTYRYAVDEHDCGSDGEILTLCEHVEAELRGGVGVYVYSRLGHGRAGMVGALLLGRLYGLSAADALFRVQLYHDARKTVQDSKRAFSCPQTVTQRALIERCLLHTDTIYAEVCASSQWRAPGYAAPRRGGGVPTLEDKKLMNAPRDARARASWALQTAPQSIPLNADMGRNEVRDAPLEQRRGRPDVVGKASMRTLRPLSVRQELDLAKKGQFRRADLAPPPRTVEDVHDEADARRRRLATPLTPLRGGRLP